MITRKKFIYAVLITFLICGLAPAQAATYSLAAVAGDTGLDIGIDGVFDGLLGGAFSTAVQAMRNNSTNEARRGVLEFDLTAITGTVFSATINADVFNFSTPAPDVEVYVYAGDGSVSLSDMTVAAILVFQARVSVTPMTPIDVTDVLQTLISGGATHFGVRVQVIGEPNFITWANGQSGRYSTLDITTIPLPSALWLLGSGLLGLVANARRQR